MTISSRPIEVGSAVGRLHFHLSIAWELGRPIGWKRSCPTALPTSIGRKLIVIGAWQRDTHITLPVATAPLM